MLTSITMPQLGESVTEGTVDRWLKREGEWVAQDEPLVEVVTDKVNAEVPSPVAGRLTRIVVPEGQTVPCRTEIAVIDVEAARPLPAAEPAAAGTSGEESAATATREDRAELAGLPYDEALRRRTTPVVRRLAQQHGVDLSAVPGTGFGGRVRKEDLLAYLQRPAVAAVLEPEPPVAEPAQEAPRPQPLAAVAVREVGATALLPVTAVRRAIAQRMTESLRAAPQVTTAFELDMTAAARLRASYRDEFRTRNGVDLTYQIVFMKAVVDALVAHPLLNATWTDEGIRLYREVNLGVAVAVPGSEGRVGDDRLLVPVIPRADRLNFRGLAQAATDVIARARAGKLRPEDVQGGTFTVNNTGALGSVVSTPILQPPQAGLITLEAIVKRPVVVTDQHGDDTIAIRHMAFSCLTFDHRVLDGLAACRFMQTVKATLEGVEPPFLEL